MGLSSDKQYWWSGRCQEIADKVNFDAAGEIEVTPRQVQDVLIAASRFSLDTERLQIAADALMRDWNDSWPHDRPAWSLAGAAILAYNGERRP